VFACLMCVGVRCGMVRNDEDRDRSRRPGVEDRGWSSTGWILSGQTIGRSSYAVCGLHHAYGDEECRFIG
jgi:hypothetical protein